ncbi:MAG: F0F1 ATP synthase subunit A [SAR324 cluster bacterium]|nr:F0F1 ATP synthase subunit A [SAR324 cluster bacterium]
MVRKAGLTSLLLFGFVSTALASEGGFTWSHLLLGWLEHPLVSMGVDPLPILDMLFVAVAIIVLAYIGGKPFRESEMVEPTGKVSLSYVMEVIVSGILNLLSGIIKHGVGARALLPLLGTYAIFIACMNLLGLVPGFNPPTDQFNVTIALGLIIFVATHVLGFRIHGSHYIQQFLGPIPWLSPLMLPIELISHCVRPMSLAIRLFGNMTGDHKVVAVFTTIAAIALPIPFMGLGILVSVLQAFVFVVLSAIYFEGAMGEAH